MKTIIQLLKRNLTKVSRAAAHSAPVVEAMEDRVLMSAAFTMTGPNGNLLPTDQRPMESLSLNYTKITF